jgi:hypothetical protein
LVDRADVVVHLAAAVGVNLIVESPVRRSTLRRPAGRVSNRSARFVITTS